MTGDPMAAASALSALSAGQLAELTAGRLLSSWQLDVPALLLIAALAVSYGWGVRRVQRRGGHWPFERAGANGQALQLFAIRDAPANRMVRELPI